MSLNPGDNGTRSTKFDWQPIRKQFYFTDNTTHHSVQITATVDLVQYLGNMWMWIKLNESNCELNFCFLLLPGHLVFGDDYAADIEKLKSQFPAGTIPDISNLTSALPFDKVMDTLKKKCNEAAGSDAAYEEAQQAATKAQECLSGLMDWNTLLEEVEAAKPTGDLEIVFNK